MDVLDVRLYDAFAAGRFGGNVAGVVYAPTELEPETMRGLAAEMGAPTTGFVRALGGDAFEVRFSSSSGEMSMCGHVTVGVFASLLDDGLIGAGTYHQETRAGTIEVSVSGSSPGARISMRQPSPRYDLFDVPIDGLAPLLGLSPGDLGSVGSCCTGLRHLLVEVKSLDRLARLGVDDGAVKALCLEHAIDTIGVFARLASGPGGADVRVRDLCHGVGDPEEAASGTTNGALASWLWRDGRLGRHAAGGRVVVRSEQGFEMGRPSLVTTELHVGPGGVEAVWVGGTATRRLEGRLFAD